MPIKTARPRAGLGLTSHVSDEAITKRGVTKPTRNRVASAKPPAVARRTSRKK